MDTTTTRMDHGLILGEESDIIRVKGFEDSDAGRRFQFSRVLVGDVLKAVGGQQVHSLDKVKENLRDSVNHADVDASASSSSGSSSTASADEVLSRTKVSFTFARGERS
jgi:hypothetical protein